MNLPSGSAEALTGLEGKLMSSCSGCFRLLLATGWMGGLLHPLLMLPSSMALMGSLASLTFRCASRGVVPFLVHETEGESQKMGAQLACQWPGYLM